MKLWRTAVLVLLAGGVTALLSNCAREQKTAYSSTSHLGDVEVTRVLESAGNRDVLASVTVSIRGDTCALACLSADQELAFLRGGDGDLLMYLPTGRYLHVSKSGELLSASGGTATPGELRDMLMFARREFLFYAPQPGPRMTLVDTKKRKLQQVSVDPPLGNPMHSLLPDEEATFHDHIHKIR